jgi:hypothetical protein
MPAVVFLTGHIMQVTWCSKSSYLRHAVLSPFRFNDDDADDDDERPGTAAQKNKDRAVSQSKKSTEDCSLTGSQIHRKSES